MLKTNCKAIPTVVLGQNTFKWSKCLTVKMITVKDSKHWKTRGYPYILCFEVEVASPFNIWIILILVVRQSALGPMSDAEKDWHERSFRASSAINGCQKSPLDKPEMEFSFFIFKPPVTFF